MTIAVKLLTAANAVVALLAAIVPYALAGRAQGTDPEFAPIEVGIAAAGALAVVTAMIVLRQQVDGLVRFFVYAVLGSGAAQLAAGAIVVVALLAAPASGWTTGLFIVCVLVSRVTAILAICVAFAVCR